MQATVTALQTLNGQTVTYYLSANGGTNWEGPVTLGSGWTFANTGADLRWRAVLSTLDTAVSPFLESLTIDYIEPTPTSTATPTYTATPT